MGCPAVVKYHLIFQMRTHRARPERPMSSTAKSQQCYQALLERLMRRALRPGELINRRAIAAELGVSVAPVVEAMVQLEAEGFLEAIPRKGTQVVVPRVEDLRGHLLLREALECQAARLYCGAPVRAQRERLRELARTIDADVDADAAVRPATYRAELAFHRALVELADCPALLREFDRVMRIGLFYQIGVALPARAERPRQAHARLLRELAHEDPQRAETAMREHLLAGRSALLATEGAEHAVSH